MFFPYALSFVQHFFSSSELGKGFFKTLSLAKCVGNSLAGAADDSAGPKIPQQRSARPSARRKKETRKSGIFSQPRGIKQEEKKKQKIERHMNLPI